MDQSNGWGDGNLEKKLHLGSCDFTKREGNSGVQMGFYN